MSTRGKKSRRTAMDDVPAAPAPVASVAAVWADIEAFLAQHQPEAHAKLMNGCPPATAQEIAAAEARMGCRLPSQLVQSLRVHDMRVVVEPLHMLGLGNSLQEGVDAALRFAGGPLATRFADSGPPPTEGGLAGLFHLFTYQEDRTYFFLTVDCLGTDEHHAVTYLDFGDLVGDPSGTVVEWSFGAYLATVRDALRSAEPPHSWFPTPQFGFQGQKRILSLFARPRTLRMAQADFMDVPDARGAIQEAYDAPDDNLMVKWVAPPSLATALAALPPPPLPLQHMEWDEALMAADWQLSEGRTVARSSSYNVHARATMEFCTFHEKNCYMELALGPGTIYNVGFCSVEAKSHSPSMAFTLGNPGALSIQTNTAGGSRGEQFVFDNVAYGQSRGFQPSDVIGLHVHDGCVTFFHNRRRLVTVGIATTEAAQPRGNHAKVVHVGDGRSLRFRPMVFGHTFESRIVNPPPPQ